ncbi:hypothetical protein V8B97DRAFT_2006508 [Scleroderma yunnanense]
MPASISPLALLVPRPQIPATHSSPSTPATNRVSAPLSLPHTPQRSPAASHLFLSPPTPHRNSTDSWNSSNYEFDDPAVVWKDDEARLLARTLDALPAHLITPFNGLVPPSNLLDKIARGIIAAKGPNDWPHTIRATRVKLLELARNKAHEERYANINQHDNHVGCKSSSSKSEKRSRTPDPSEVLQSRTNTPNGMRRPLYRQSSMDFMSPVCLDRHESITRLSTRFQRHDRTLHHPYLRPAHRRRSEYASTRSFSPSTPSSTTLNSNNLSLLRKSTASSTSTSTSSFGSPMSNCVPLRPSSLRRASTATLASTSDVQVELPLAQPERRLRNGSDEVVLRANGVSKDQHAPIDDNGSKDVILTPVISMAPPSKPIKKSTKATSNKKPRAALPAKKMQSPCPVVELAATPRTPPPETRGLAEEKSTPNNTPSHTHVKKARKGHKPQLSLSSDEEYMERSKSAKKARTREPSWSDLLASPPPPQPLFASPHIAVARLRPLPKASTESTRSISTGRGSETGTSDSSRMDNDLSTGSTDTGATSISAASLTKPKTPRNDLRLLTQSPTSAKKSVRRNLARNPSMFGAELPNPQKTPESPARIPLSSPRVVSPPMSFISTSHGSPSSVSTPALSPGSARPRTLRRAARRIEFGTIQPNPWSPVEDASRETGGTLTLGSAFQLA